MNRSNAEQLQASNPTAQVWVSASAGSGKTKVLTDRVLRLLLEGALPSRILCITYTKAAATEMQTRLFEHVSAWVMMDDATLRAHIEAITGEIPSSRTLTRARTLFATLLEAHPGLRIQTIHSFCQSVLTRFPLEAGVPPGFDIVDERTSREMLHAARQWLLGIGLSAQVPEALADVREALHQFALELGENKFHDIIANLIAQRRTIEALLQRLENLAPQDKARQTAQLREALWGRLGLQAHWQTPQDIHRECLPLDATTIEKLRAVALTMLEEETAASTRGYAQDLLDFATYPSHEPAQLAKLTETLLTSGGTPRQNFPSSKTTKKLDWAKDFISLLAARCMVHEAALSSLASANESLHSISLARALFERYRAMKEARGLLDYEDLIQATGRLLCGEDMMPWVLYKLDGGLEHLLIDEAQDTAPLQWQLVHALVEEFYSGENAQTKETPRTIFVVGDEKQSIYRFQGADVQNFIRTRSQLEHYLKQRSFALDTVRLARSFRSTPAILALVDAVFAQDAARQGLGDATIAHTAFREAKPGTVEVWPLVPYHKKQEQSFFPIPTTYQDSQNTTQILAQRIASTIAHWLRSGRHLLAKERPLTAGDILILVKKRGQLVGQLARELKRHGVPIAGVDRLVLTDHIAVKDMLALVQFLLLPEDDLTLACLLRSPLYDVDEQTLFTLAHDRGHASLWSRVRSMAQFAPAVANAKEELEQLLSKADMLTPYDLLSEVLYGRKGRARMIGRMGEEVIDPLTELLRAAHHFERLHAPSLQGFLHWMSCDDQEIKRDMEQGADAVRIMTVHGSKGLQAPIVILPDTTSDGSKHVHLLADEPEAALPLIFPYRNARGAAPYVAQLNEARKQAETEENNRLLYVALTRAEEELIIAGVEPGRSSTKHWYHTITSGMDTLGEACLTLPAQESYPFWPHAEEAGDIRRYCLHHPTTSAALSKDSSAAAAMLSAAEHPIPSWLDSPPPEEPTPAKPLTPSEMMEILPASIIPGASVATQEERVLQQRFALAYGTAVHRLLHLAGCFAPSEREARVKAYLEQHLPPEFTPLHPTMLSQVMQVLGHPTFAPLFGFGSLAEAPITGCLEDGTVVSGRIDRLLVTPDEVLVVDFKTGKAPTDTSLIPAAYAKQMELYAKLLRNIYPQHRIRTALLYVSEPVLIPLEHLAA